MMIRKIIQLALIVAVCWFADYVARAAELRVPEKAVAGSEISLQSDSSGTLYLFGPGTAIKRNVQGGEQLKLTLNHAGQYTAILHGQASSFMVQPGPVANIAFLARPSRVPANKPSVISGTAFLFDKQRNLAVMPATVEFDLNVTGGKSVTQDVKAKNGIAWVKLDSGRRAGAAQFVASVGNESVRRVVQETAAEPCNLRMHAQRDKNGVVVETDPVKDCTGNPVPDGTIVTFTMTDSQGRSTIDSHVIKGIARAKLPPMRNAQLSVASGVVVGNEIHWEGGE